MQAWKSHVWSEIWAKLPHTLPISTVSGAGRLPTASSSRRLPWLHLSHLRYTGQWQWSIEKFWKGAAGCWLGRRGTLKFIRHRRAMASVRKQELWTQHALWDKTDTKGHSCGISLTRASTTNKSVRTGRENVSRGWRGRNRQQQQLPYFASVINAMGLYKAKGL